MSACQPSLVHHRYIGSLDKGPFQVAVDVATNLSHTSPSAAGTHPRRQTRVAGEMSGAGKAIYIADFESDHHAQDPPHPWQRLESFGLGRQLGDGLQPPFDFLDLQGEDVQRGQLQLDAFLGVGRQPAQTGLQLPSSVDAVNVLNANPRL